MPLWQNGSESSELAAWKSLAFEAVCRAHVEQIRAALGISGVRTACSSWSLLDEEQGGAQVDLVIDRSDNVVNACECKFYGGDFAVTKDYYRTLLNGQRQLAERIPRRKTAANVLITTFGLKHNEYSGVFPQVITLDDLFVWGGCSDIGLLQNVLAAGRAFLGLLRQKLASKRPRCRSCSMQLRISVAFLKAVLAAVSARA